LRCVLTVSPGAGPGVWRSIEGQSVRVCTGIVNPPVWCVRGAASSPGGHGGARHSPRSPRGPARREPPACTLETKQRPCQTLVPAPHTCQGWSYVTGLLRFRAEGARH
jgi:hypothetical protein